MPTKSRLAAAALGATAVATIPSAVFATSYIVRPGDTASDIAVRHGTTVAALLTPTAGRGWSSSTSVRCCTSLTHRSRCPRTHGAATTPRPTGSGRGEGVFETARRFGVDPTALARANGIGVNAPIAEGDELIVPGRLARA